MHDRLHIAQQNFASAQIILVDRDIDTAAQDFRPIALLGALPLMLGQGSSSKLSQPLRY
ncbi:MAG: hypothetical protein WB646_01860 [Steroidobacteraceae bacterium]